MESFAGFRFFKVAGSVFDFNGLRVLLQANPRSRRYLLLVLITAWDVVVDDDENDNAFASSREDKMVLNLHEEPLSAAPTVSGNVSLLPGTAMARFGCSPSRSLCPRCVPAKSWTSSDVSINGKT